MKHETVEKKIGLMGVLIALVVSVGGLVEIVPLLFSSQVNDAAPGTQPDTYWTVRVRSNIVWTVEAYRSVCCQPRHTAAYWLRC